MINESTKDKMQILVIEDELPLMEAIKAKLEKNGFEVITARSITFSSLLDLGQVDAIWLDHYLLGKENGLDFVKKLKAKGSRLNKTPIFVVSNTASPAEIKSYKRLGITKYYVKAEHRIAAIVDEIKLFLDRSK